MINVHIIIKRNININGNRNVNICTIIRIHRNNHVNINR